MGSEVTRFFGFIAAVLMAVAPARADSPVVVTDIAPVHSLVAIVMLGMGTPLMIVPPGGGAHGATLRPSQARALQRADLVIWMGPGLTPRLSKSIETLAGGAVQLQLLGAPGTQLLSMREDGDHDGDHSHDDDGLHDPHAWLDPENGHLWLGLIADVLAVQDPENAAKYRANALAGQGALRLLQSELTTLLKPMRGRAYVTFHDAYQYFETRFGLSPAGAVSASDAGNPGPARVARLRALLAKTGRYCAFSAPQFDPGLLHAVTGRDDLRIIPLDPIGGQLTAGPGLYPSLLRNMAAAFAECAQAR
ncbi:MAG: zinc ABC transporter substrate-binding protein [Rhodobacteraceae bacterium]|nr:zinc ABC transporter substrate-binding protein [Paracoccaceae bacterium]